jgi:phosphate starvation-inducible PhoH-like protein
LSRQKRKNSKSRKNHKRSEFNSTERRAEPTAIWNKKALKPMNDKQKSYINMINNHKIVCSTGVAGSGKSYIASMMAADMLVDPRVPISSIIVARPNEMEGTTTIGLLPGTVEEKLAPWLAPIIQTLKQRLGSGHFEAYVASGVIEFLPLEMIKGRSLNNVFLICDESEDIQWPVLKTLLLRIGRDCKVVIDGDIRQTSISKESGLQKLLDLNENFYLPIQFIDFDSWEYCVRGPECKLFGEIFEEAGV